LYISLEAAGLCLLGLKIKDATEKFKNHQNLDSSPKNAALNQTTFSQTETGVTFSLNSLHYLSPTPLHTLIHVSYLQDVLEK
jgi:hypothetical protein